MKPLYYYISLPLTLSVNCMFINVWQILIHSGPKFCDVETRFSWNKTHFVTLLVIFSFFISFHVCTLCIYLYIAVCFLPVAESAHLHWIQIVYPRFPGDSCFYGKIPLKALWVFFFYLSLSFYSTFLKITEIFIFNCQSIFWVSVNRIFMNVNVWQILMFFDQS